MSLVIFNGSPRGKSSNSKLMSDSFLKGFLSTTEENSDIYYLINKKETGAHKEAFKNAEEVIFIFPLYTDAMPGMVKEFFEEVEEYDSSGKKIGFIVHSGFPEAVHSMCLAEYLKRFSEIIKAEYIGTVITGESEALKFMSEKMKNKKLSPFYNLGREYGLNHEFNREITNELGKTYKFNKFILAVLKVLISLGIFNIGWDKVLKKNNSFQKRFYKPYQNSK